MRFNELDVVTLRSARGRLPAGAVGTVLEVFEKPSPAYIVEFCDDDGVAIDMPTLTDEELAPYTAPAPAAP